MNSTNRHLHSGPSNIHWADRSWRFIVPNVVEVAIAELAAETASPTAHASVWERNAGVDVPGREVEFSAAPEHALPANAILITVSAVIEAIGEVDACSIAGSEVGAACANTLPPIDALLVVATWCAALPLAAVAADLRDARLWVATPLAGGAVHAVQEIWRAALASRAIGAAADVRLSSKCCFAVARRALRACVARGSIGDTCVLAVACAVTAPCDAGRDAFTGRICRCKPRLAFGLSAATGTQ